MEATATSMPALVYSTASDSRGIVEPDGVRDGQHAGLLVLRVAHGHERVHGLAGLGDGDDERGAVEHRVAVAELGGELDLAGDARPVLDGVLGDEPGVVGGAAGDDEDLVDVAEVLVGHADLVEDDLPGLVDAPAKGVGDRGGLLVDLLAHEGLEAALLGGGDVPVHLDRACPRRASRRSRGR